MRASSRSRVKRKTRISRDSSFFQKRSQIENTFFSEPNQASFFTPKSGGANSNKTSFISRKCDQCEDQDKNVNKKDASSTSTKSSGSAVSTYIGGLSGKGTSMPGHSRSFFESRIGHDFSNVKIHNNPEASQSAKSINALAYTYKNHIVFKDEKYNPDSHSGKKLLAHELTHVIQQGKSKPTVDIGQKTRNKVSGKIQKSDASFESGSGVDSGIASGTMVSDAIMGNTYEADNCRGLFGCNVGFNFEKAYKGVYPYVAAGKDVKGVYVKIVGKYDHNVCGTCDTIKLIQVVRNITKGTKGKIITADPDDPTRRERSGWSDKKAPSRGWRVDRLVTATVPFYGSAGFSVQEGSNTKDPILWDSPGDWSTTTNAGKEFETFLVCDTGGAADRKTIAGVRWGYYTNSTGDVSFRPATPIANCGPTKVLKDSVKRWEGIAGNKKTGIDFTEEKGINHDGLKTVMFFNVNSTDLTSGFLNSDFLYKWSVRMIRQHIMATFPLTRIRIHGYSSTDGDPAYNMKLSIKRAESIRTRLISDGIPAFMLEVVGHGENSDFPGKELNRRVEIEFTSWTLSDMIKNLLAKYNAAGTK